MEEPAREERWAVSRKHGTTGCGQRSSETKMKKATLHPKKEQRTRGRRAATRYFLLKEGPMSSTARGGGENVVTVRCGGTLQKSTGERGDGHDAMLIGNARQAGGRQVLQRRARAAPMSPKRKTVNDALASRGQGHAVPPRAGGENRGGY
ncbi:hypothetical protein TRVL_08258 [Trypanosoma vivax]|nr:hypothetical protein TRVL_08258 [Trypanosoma vivax]